jgi:ubiquinone biosynthesis protein COQ9
MVTDIAKKHANAKECFLSSLPKALAGNCWSKNILLKANTECGFTPGYYHILFPNGLKEIVMAYEEWQDRQMLELLGKEEKPKKIRQMIARALEIRLMQIVPKQASLNQSSYFLLPTNICQGLECASITCDVIWRFAGDKSTDFNYYTKRGLLLPVYLSAQAYYFADESAEHQKTKEFIDSSLDNIINIASLKNKIKLPSIEDIPILRLFS